MNVASAALLVGLLAVLPARAEKEAWIVLVRSDGAMPASWRPAIQEAARKAAASSEKVAWQEPPAVSLEEAELALGCRGWGAPCAGQIATMMNAGAALVVEIEGDGPGATLRTAVVSAAGDARAGTHKEAKLPDRGAQGLAIAQAHVVGAIRGSPPTIVVIDSDMPGVDVAIDGVKSGRTPLTLVDELPPGEHRVTLSREGRAPFSTTIDVVAGKASSFTFPMGAGGPAPMQPTVGTSPPSSTVMPMVAYATTGAGAVLALAAAGLGAGYGYTYLERKRIADDAVNGVVQTPGQMPRYKLMEDLAIWLAVGGVTAAAGSAVFLGTGLALLLAPPDGE